MEKLRTVKADDRHKSFADAKEIYDKLKGKGAFDGLSRAEKLYVLTKSVPDRGMLYMNNWLEANYPLSVPPPVNENSMP
jgi:hypothetical protein